MEMNQIAVGFMWFVAFLLSTTVHEAMHAWAAWKGGDPTAYHGGQVSLSPLPHIQREPIGMLVVPLITAMMNGWAMGWASAPYDPYWAARHPKRAALMAAAGPAGNFMIAALGIVIIKVGVAAGWFLIPERGFLDQIVISPMGDNGITTMLSILVVLNVLLGVFNLIPLPPLDGASVALVFLPDQLRSQVRDWTANGSLSLLGLLAAWFIFPRFLEPLFGMIMTVLRI